MYKLSLLLAFPLIVGCVVDPSFDDEGPLGPQIDLPEPVQEFFASSTLSTSGPAAAHVATAKFSVVDADGWPAAGVTVTAKFTGEVDHKFTAVTDSYGSINVQSPAYVGHLVVGLTLDSLTYVDQRGYEHEGALIGGDVAPRGCGIP